MNRPECLEKAEESYRKSLELEPENPSYINNLAWLLINHDINIDEGLKLIDRALLVNRMILTSSIQRAGDYTNKGSTEQALEILKKAWDLLPEYDHDIFLHVQEVEN